MRAPRTKPMSSRNATHSRLRILFLAGRDPLHPAVGGGDLQAWAWARWCVQQGHRVVYVCQAHESLAKAEVRDGIQVFRLGTSICLALRGFRYYRRHAAEFDLVYEDPIGAGRSPYLAPLYSRVPVVAVWHQVSAPLLRALHGPFIAFLLALAERLVARAYHSSLLWVPSDERAQEVVRHLGFRESKIAVIPPTHTPPAGVRPDRLPRPPTLLVLGVIRPYKSVEHVIRVFPSVLAQVPGARLVVAGRRMDTKYEARLRRLTRQLELEDRVDFRLDLPDQAKHELLASARVLVLPSLLEGFGIVALEANAFGTPVVASSGVPIAAVTHEGNGLRYAYGDLDQLSVALVRLLMDDKFHSECSERALASVQGFEPARVGIIFDQLLTRAVKSDHPETDDASEELGSHA